MDALVFNGIGSNGFDVYSTTSFAVRTSPGSWLIVDVGPDTPRMLRRAEIAPLDVSAVVITHRHLDHCLGLPYFLFSRRLAVLAERRKNAAYVPPALTVAIEPDLWQHLISLYQLCHPDEHDLLFELRQRPLDGTATISLPNINITPVPMNHTVPTYGLFLKDTDGRTLAYTSDSTPLEAFCLLPQPIDVLIAEAMVPHSESAFAAKTCHATAKEAGLTASRLKPRCAYLVHLRPLYAATRANLEREASSDTLRMEYPPEGVVLRPWGESPP